MIRRGLLTMIVAFSCGLAACGGGGSEEGDGTVSVTFEYPQTIDVQLFGSVNIVPTLSGLKGQAPTVTVSDLFSGGLPPGMTVDASTGAIGGTALQPGHYLLGANLTLSGVEGNVTTSFDIVVHSDVDASYGSLAPTVFVGNALPPMSPTLSGILPGDVLSFSQSPTQPLPAGLSIDALTGITLVVR
jgi:hypothetical protein